MLVEDYVKFICEKATELSVPRRWPSFNSRLQQVMNGRPIVAVGGHRMIEHCAVVGGGVMGQGITIALLKAGYRTTLIEKDEQTLAKSMRIIWRIIAEELRKGRLTEATAANASQHLRGSTDFESLRDADFVIEAVFENTQLKVDLFRTLDRVCPAHAVLCTNTSTLDIERIAKATSRPSNVVGMHFFSPPHINRALEVIYCGDVTSQGAVAITVAVGCKLEKIPVLMRNATAFVVNRMMRSYLSEAVTLLNMGHLPDEVDRAFRNFGLPMGPFQLLDLIGLDTWQRVCEENGWDVCNAPKILCDSGRLGRKTGKGFYLYMDNRRHNDEELERILANLRTAKERPHLTNEEIIRMCLYPSINEGFNVLSDRVVERPEIIDVLWILGLSWPVSKGGPMYWAQTEGLRSIYEYLRNKSRDDASYQWSPSPLLKRVVETGAVGTPLAQWSAALSKL